jgi:uncharacterized protein YbjT (DUF2867 family)
MILVTGATGTIGSAVIQHLTSQNVPIRALLRDVKKGSHLSSHSIEVVQGDFLHPDTLDAALQGVEKAFLLSANDARQIEMESNFIDATKRMGVQHIVKLSVLAADVSSPSTFQKWHGEIEQKLEQSGIKWTHLQPNMLMQNVNFYASTIAESNNFFLCVGDAVVSHVDARDVAAVAAICLTEPGHESKRYVLTGTEAITFTEVAKILSDAFGKEISYVNVPPENLKQAMLNADEAEWFVDAELELFSLWANGMGAVVTNTIAEITKHTPTSFNDFARDLAVSNRAKVFFK